jgi:hypothetical protein
MDDRLLGIYLNDHLAGATAGLELARRSHGRNRDGKIGAPLGRIADEIEEDRQSLVAVMQRLGVAANVAKTSFAWLAERVGRLKLNGHLLSYSPLSRVEELEALRLGVEGKLSLWRTLKETRGSDPRLEGVDLDDLSRRAESQRDELEEMRVASARNAFGATRPQRSRR